GRVCMDLCMIDVTHIPGVTVGDSVSLLGGEGETAIRSEELADWAGSIPYEILAGISARVPRVYPDTEIANKPATR
ncbi:MAG: alanine racemase C-terminal domain-containing protein, partial [Pseudomonadota bacterium]